MIQLLKAVKILADAGVDFIIVGGVAVRSHGSSYVTEDLDICYSRKTGNLSRLAEALLPFKPRPRNFPDDLPFIWDQSTLRQGTNFTLRTTLCDIDLLGEVKGLGSYEDLVPRSITIDLDGSAIQILSIEALITAKEAAGRPKDIAGLNELYALRDLESEESD